MILFCTTCQKFLNASEMKMVVDWKGGRGGRNTAIFLDDQIAHTFLTKNGRKRKEPSS